MGKPKTCINCEEILLDPIKCDDCGAMQGPSAPSSDVSSSAKTTGNKPSRSSERVVVTEEIQNHVPSITAGLKIPPRRSGAVELVLPFQIMKAGDSFFIPHGHYKSISTLQSKISDRSRNEFPDRKYQTRRTEEALEQGGKLYRGIRCWRIE